VPAPRPELWESYLHDVPLPDAPAPLSRGGLSWWSLLGMRPALPSDLPAWSPASDLLDAQGLAILRTDGRYASLECGPWTEGHGHPDRLHLTLHAGGVPWLVDFGTGSYLTSDLAWYRSTLAHNAPRVDGASQTGGDATCEAFDARDRCAWVRGRWAGGDVSRTFVSCPGYLVDVVELGGRVERVLELPWHMAGAPRVVSPGRWAQGDLSDPFVSGVEQFEPEGSGPVELEAVLDGKMLAAHLVFDGVLLKAEGPARPGAATRETFLCVRVKGQAARLVTVLEPVGEARLVRTVRAKGELIEVDTAAGTDRHQMSPGGWTVEGPSGKVRLAGRRKPEPPF